MMVKTHNQLFVITEADLFYEINIYDENFPSFVLCDNNSIIESMIVKKLSGKNIINLSYGFCHFFAWNDKNEIFCWGNNSCGQLGIGKRDDETTSLDFINTLRHNKKNSIPYRSFGKHQNEPELNVFLSNLNIVDIRCGFWHSLALTNNGDVYAWGLISTGESIEKMSQTTPIKVNGFDGEKVVKISCGYKHSLALTESGRVFSWGENSYGQLGTGNEINREKPKMIEIENVSFKKIGCGQRHSLLLSSDGVIYAFGDNRCGQIGCGNQETQNKPIKLTGYDRFIDITSFFMEDISVAQSINKNFYVWGNCGEETNLTPLLTSCKSFDEVFSNYTYIQFKLRDNDLIFRDNYFVNEFTVIGKKLEHGTFEKVFKVKDKKGNYFAIKKVKPIDDYENDFLREYIKQSIVNQIGSEFFVKHYDTWLEKKRNSSGFTLYIKMELCDKTLKDVMNEIHTEFLKKEDKTLNPIGYYLASEIFIDILKGVLYLHQHKVTHRNLNPSNILLKKESNGEISVKIIDFGLSKLHEFTEQSHTQDRGMYRYVAPEVMNSNTNGVKADIYSLGIILENLFKIDPTKYVTNLLYNVEQILF
jgi:alpha-tubulin suppressor-like RCC1 family protein